MNKHCITHCIRFSFVSLFLSFMVGCGSTSNMTLEECLQGTAGGLSVALPRVAPLDEIVSLTCGGSEGAFTDLLTDTQGIEQLTALEELTLRGSFSSVNLSQQTQLVSLLLNSANLAALDVSQNTALESLTLVGGQFLDSVLDLSQQTALTDIAIHHQLGIEDINLPSTASMEAFTCMTSDIKTVDFSQSAGLTHIDIRDCEISDVSSLLGLTNLQTVIITQMENIPCAQLDALEAIVSEQVFRPDTCVQ